MMNPLLKHVFIFFISLHMSHSQLIINVIINNHSIHLHSHAQIMKKRRRVTLAVKAMLAAVEWRIVGRIAIRCQLRIGVDALKLPSVIL